MHNKSCFIPLKIKFKVLKLDFELSPTDVAHHLESKKCANCAFETVSSIMFLKHACTVQQIEQHNDGNIEHCKWFNCVFCDYKCPRADFASLQQHVLQKHNGIEDKCKFCGYENTNSAQLEAHLLTKHSKACTTVVNFNLRCNQCHYTTNTQGALQNHIYQKHKKKRLEIWHECPHCEHKSASKQSLNLHIYRKHKQGTGRWYECGYCEYKTLSSAVALRKHVIFKHTKDEDIVWYNCQFCQYRAKAEGILKTHTKNKHEQRQITWLDCKYCEAKFKVKASLKSHLFANHPEQFTGEVYKCLFCDFRSVHRGEVNTHTKSAHIENPVKCQYCDTTCRNEMAYKRHVRAAKHVARQSRKS